MTTSALAGLSKTDSRTSVGGGQSARHRRQASAALIALTALIAPGFVVGCGGGGKSNSSNSASRAQTGKVTFTVRWPERTRLVPLAANSIVVTLTRRPDADIPATEPAVVKTQTLTRPPAPPAGQPLDQTAEFVGIETGTYEIVATTYPGPNGPGTIDPVTGENVPLSTNGNKTLRDTIVVVADTTTTVTVSPDSTIATLVPGLPGGFVQTPGSALPNAVSSTAVTRIRPGQLLDLSAAAFDAASNRVLLTDTGVVATTKITFTSSNPAVASVNGATGLVTAGAVAVEGTTTITVTDTESGKTGTLSVTVTPVGLSVTAPWAKFHGDLANTGRQVAVSAPNLNVGAGQTSFATGSRFQFSSPVVGADGTTYIGTFTRGTSANDKKLYALNAANGLKWQFDPGGDVDTAPIIGADGTIFFTTTDGKIWAVRDTTTGPRVLWTVNLNTLTGRTTPINVSLTLDRNGILYVPTASPDNRLYAIDSLTGVPIQATDTVAGTNRNWVFQTNDQITNTPTLSADQTRLYVADNSANVYLIQTGIPAVVAPLSGTPIYGNAALESVQVALDAGAPAGTMEGVAAALTLVANRPAGPALFVTTTGSNRLIALDPTSLAQLDKANGSNEAWIIDSGGAVYSTPAVSPDGSLLYYATQDYSSGIFDHKVACVSTADGSLVWRTRAPDESNAGRFTEGFNASPTLSTDGSQLYIAGFDGYIYGFDATPPLVGDPADEAREPTVFNIPTALPGGANPFLGSPAIRGDGTVIIGGDNGRVYFVK